LASINFDILSALIERLRLVKEVVSDSLRNSVCSAIAVDMLSAELRRIEMKSFLMMQLHIKIQRIYQVSSKSYKDV
jgi:hypothetical protein